jgi:hypothetical protein
MKRFDIATEISKQLITLSSAFLVGISALAGNILLNEANVVVFNMLVFLYSLLGLSIIFGILNLGAIVNALETAERRDFEKNADASMKHNGFVSVFENPVGPIFCGLQQVFFVLAIILLVATLIIDRNVT